MRAVRLGALCVVLLSRAPAAPAPAELPPAALEVLKQIEQEAAEIEKKLEADIVKLREKKIVELQKVQDAYCRDAKLDEAVAVRDFIRALKAGRDEVPGGLPPAVGEVLKQHEIDIDGLKLRAQEKLDRRRDVALFELKRIQDAFCREAKLDEAVAVRDLIRNLRDGTVNALPDPGYVNNGANDIGKVLFYEVVGVGQGAGQSIYGTDVYTTGSHLGMAAVHCGLLAEGQKGMVKVTILPGQGRYDATTRNGVTSIAYGAWGVSFKVERASALPVLRR
jgi:hypothetical protein